MKKLFFFIIFIALFFLSFIIVRNYFLRIEVEHAIEDLVGFNYTIDSIDFSFFDTSVRINGLRCYNPRVFGDDVCIYAPEVMIAIDLLSYLKTGVVRLREVGLYIEEFTVVRDEHNDANIYYFSALHSPPSGAGPYSSSPSSFLIDRLRLTLQKVRYIDYRRGGMPEEFKLPIQRQVFPRIRSLKWVVQIVVYKALKETLGNRGLAIDIDRLKQTLIATSGRRRVELDVFPKIVTTPLVKEFDEELPDSSKKLVEKRLRRIMHRFMYETHVLVGKLKDAVKKYRKNISIQ